VLFVLVLLIDWHCAEARAYIAHAAERQRAGAQAAGATGRAVQHRSAAARAGQLSGNEPKQVQVRDLVGAIDAAAKDKRITRILLLPDDLQGGGFAALREVGAALDRFRAAASR
jgi:hypothetical protein